MISTEKNIHIRSVIEKIGDLLKEQAIEFYNEIKSDPSENLNITKSKKARAENITSEQRSELARQAALKRWRR